MRYIWLTFLGLAVVIAVVSWRNHAAAPTANSPTPTSANPVALVSAIAVTPSTTPPAPRRLTLSQALLRGGGDAASITAASVADSLIAFSLRQLGVPYLWAGTTPAGGFDCSGFLMYAYAHVGVPVPHSTALLIDTGRPVPRPDARPGDLVIFTGTAATSTTPGHAGIIISKAGEVPMRFVHSSSARRESGVKISQVEGTDYERRFMQVRRVLGGALVAGTKSGQPDRVAPAPPRPRIAAILAPLEARPAAVQLADDTEPTRPVRLAPLARQPAATHSRTTTKQPVFKKAVKPVRKAPSSKAKAKAKGSLKPKPKAAVKTQPRPVPKS